MLHAREVKWNLTQGYAKARQGHGSEKLAHFLSVPRRTFARGCPVLFPKYLAWECSVDEIGSAVCQAVLFQRRVTGKSRWESSARWEITSESLTDRVSSRIFGTVVAYYLAT